MKVLDDVSDLGATDIAKHSVGRGATKGSLGAVHKITVQKLLDSMGDKKPAALDTVAGKRTIEFLSALAVLSLIESPLGEKLPKREMLSNGSAMLIEQTTARGTDDLMKSVSELIKPIISQYTTALKELEDKGIDLDDFVASKTPEVVKASK